MIDAPTAGSYPACEARFGEVSNRSFERSPANRRFLNKTCSSVPQLVLLGRPSVTDRRCSVSAPYSNSCPHPLDSPSCQVGNEDSIRQAPISVAVGVELSIARWGSPDQQAALPVVAELLSVAGEHQAVRRADCDRLPELQRAQGHERHHDREGGQEVGRLELAQAEQVDPDHDDQHATHGAQLGHQFW